MFIGEVVSSEGFDRILVQAETEEEAYRKVHQRLLEDWTQSDIDNGNVRVYLYPITFSEGIARIF